MIKLEEPLVAGALPLPSVWGMFDVIVCGGEPAYF